MQTNATKSAQPAPRKRPKLPVIIASWRRNVREEIRVALDRYQDCEVIDVRTWFTDATGAMKPTRTGITLAVDRHLEPFAKALRDAVTKARELGLIPQDATIDGGKS